ncbi:MAG: DUF3631 domain-containing protein, partial [Candidatus Binataceae bacterium]
MISESANGDASAIQWATEKLMRLGQALLRDDPMLAAFDRMRDALSILVRAEIPPELREYAPPAGIDKTEIARMIDVAAQALAQTALEATVASLRSADPAERLIRRKFEAKRLGISAAALDALIDGGEERPTAGKGAKSPQWAPVTKIAPGPVSGDDLIVELVSAIRHFIMLDERDALIVALWIIFTWTFEHTAETNPFLRIISPTPECGKSTLLKVVKFLSRSAWLVARLSTSSFVRTLDRERRTLLLDEGDAFLNENEVMRNVLDGASDPDTANISMSIKSGDDWAPAEFSVFVPIAIVSIGGLRRMQTVESRSIAVHLKRATRAELKKLSKGRHRDMKARLEPIAARAARWATDHIETLKGARPSLPDELSGRGQDRWEPLVAIADALSEGVGQVARAAATAECGAPADSDTLSITLLGDLRELLADRDAEKIASKALCEELAALEGRAWAEYGRARRPITQTQLARLLSAFQIVPKTVRLNDGSTPRGYELKDFSDVFARYLADPKTEQHSQNGDS